MRIALVQTNPTIGDVTGNTRRIIEYVRRAASERADLVVLPEQAILGYPAKDLLLRSRLIAANVGALRRIADAAAEGLSSAPQGGGLSVLVGFADVRSPGQAGRGLHNAAALLQGGRVVQRWHKRLLPTYDVFDEARYFEPGSGPQPVLGLAGRKLGVTICEDLLYEEAPDRRLYDCDPLADLAAAGADLCINLSASPYVLGKHAWRIARLTDKARAYGMPILYVNQVGGNDELLFDGASCAVAADGRVIGQARAFDEDLVVLDLDQPHVARHEAIPAGPASVHDALVMGLRDYVGKCGFQHVVIGLSGGVDSAVVAALAAAALGPGRVHGVALPSRYSSGHSLEDARTLAENLGIRFSVIPIEDIHAGAERTLAPHFAGRSPDATEENIQVRIRGMILMALSNKFGSMLLSTGNKSELGVGYCTLYGDMCGGLAVISDVPKTMVYDLARHINRAAGRAVIPERTLTKPPSAELRPNQTDQDTLPPYEVLDPILRLYDEEGHSPSEIVAAGFDPQVVARVVSMIRANEYKRRQAAPGLKVTTRAFGFGRRMPIAARSDAEE